MCHFIKDESNYQNAVGIQIYAIARPKQPQFALTTIFPLIINGLSAIGKINFYAIANNFLEYQNIYNAQSVSLQLGFNYIFNKK